MTLLHYPGHLAAIALLLAAIGFFAVAFRTAQWRQLRLAKWVLPVLQFLPVLLLIVLLWDPARALTRAEEKPNTVLVAFDTSESMSVAGNGGANRLDEAIQAFETAFQPGAENRPQYTYYGFDGTLHEAASPRALPRWGLRTSLAPVLDLLGRSAPPAGSVTGDVVGAVIFTDGQTLEKNAAAVPKGRPDGFQVLVVGVGSDERQADLSVDGLDTPPRVRLDAAAEVTVTVSGSPPADAAIRVEITKDGLPFATRELSGASVASGATLDFRVPADTLGQHTLEARISADLPEITLANNARQSTYDVVEEPKLEVLFYSQWASFDIGKMRQVLDGEKKVHLDFVLDAVLDGPDIGRRGPRRAEAPRQRFPAEAEALYAYDVIVLGPCDPRSFSAAQLENLYGFVAERGGGLLLIPGEDDCDWALSRDPKIKSLLPGACTPGAGVDAQPFSAMAITPEGSALGLSSPGGSAGDDIELSTYYAVAKKPAATAAATIGSEPAIVSQRVGRGNVALLNLRHLYRLYREDQDGGTLRELTSGLVTHLGAAVHEESRIQILAERSTGDPRLVEFTAVVRDALYKPASGATVLLTAAGQVARMDEGRTGEYRAAIHTDGQETLIARAEAARDGIFLGETTIAARLPLPEGEMAHLERNRPFLESVVERLGASYVDLERLGPAEAERFPAVTAVERVRDIQSAWRNWWWLGSLCGLVTAGWFARRMAGLV